MMGLFPTPAAAPVAMCSPQSLENRRPTPTLTFPHAPHADRRPLTRSICTWVTIVWLLLAAGWLSGLVFAQSPDSVSFQIIQLESSTIHLRSGDRREWDRFPRTSQGAQWEKQFECSDPTKFQTLRIRQVDVRRDWDVQINGQKIGKLVQDANDQVQLLELPEGLLVKGRNQLSIVGQDTQNSDDILIGPASLIAATPDAYRQQSRLQVTVVDPNHPDAKLPCKITIVDANLSLVPLWVKSNERVAVRPGVVYSLDGVAEISLPAGRYQVFANRGFEYSQARMEVELNPGDSLTVKLQIERVVDTRGWVACDPHVHTVTHSGHGDCTIEERMITLAGEGIELPVATDHNLQIDYQPVARRKGADQYFTPIVGNEVTTDFGHFNAFPLPAPGPLPDHRETDWSKLLPAIKQLGAQMIILNHGRDLHRGYRPLAPVNFNSATGQSLNGRPFLFNAMEVINSAAQQSDPYELFRDWLAMVNGGHRILPIGSSDSHDVNAFIVGQGRTYIRADDDRPGDIDVPRALESLMAGRVSVSCGLLGEMQVNGKFGPGDLVAGDEELSVDCRMIGPHWLVGRQMQLFRNGVLIEEKEFPATADAGQGSWERQVRYRLPKMKHDSFLVLLVSGPGYLHPAWRLAQPYQPTGPRWEPEIFGFTGAMWIDGDGDGRFTSAREYAEVLVQRHGADLKSLVAALADYDPAVAVQAAGLFHPTQGNLLSEESRMIWGKGSEVVRRGFVRFLKAWKESEQARVLE